MPLSARASRMRRGWPVFPGARSPSAWRSSRLEPDGHREVHAGPPCKIRRRQLNPDSELIMGADESHRLHYSAGPRKCCGMIVANPSTILTGLTATLICADFKPERLAMTVIVPAESVERTATRLTPPSVFRKRLLVESILPRSEEGR